MKFLEIMQESLLGLSIAIMLPAVTYWGINTFYSAPKAYSLEKTEQETPEAKAAEATQARELQNYWDNYQQISFWTYFIVALLTISLGAFLRNYSLSVGFIGGGILSLLVSIFRNPNTAGANFIIFLFLLTFLIFITTYRKRVQCTGNDCI